ncbi:MAG TPA: hypothetical protein VGB63_13870 [Pedobacter sp.]
MVVFDYIFYRVAKFFYKKDGIDAMRAFVILTVIQGLMLGAIMFSILRLKYDLSQTVEYKKLSGQIGMVIFVILLLCNYLRYKGKYWRFAERWKNIETEKQRKVRGVLVVLAILLPFFLVFWMGTSGYRQ